MSRRTIALVTAGAGAAFAVAWGVRRGRREEADPDPDALFTVYAPGGRYGFFCNGPVGRVTAWLMPIVGKGVYALAAELLELGPDDELLDIGCGPGAFLATRAQHVRRVVGLDPSPLMLRVAERRLATRIASGTARLVSGSAEGLPFGDGEFSAVSALRAPVKHAEAFRVLRPGGRLVIVDPDPRRSASEVGSAWGTSRWSEADHRRMLEDAGFTDVAIRYGDTPAFSSRRSHAGGELFATGRRPPDLPPDTVADVGSGAGASIGSPAPV
jgi:SAM-dependent methyltransferase